MDDTAPEFDKGPASKFDSTTTFEEIRRRQADFATARNWDQYHTPRNLLCALVGEVGELSEIFQWKGEVKVGVPEFTNKEKTHLGEELSDVALYLIRLADRCDIDLPSVILRKLKRNAEKYPAGKVYGSSKKYSEYSDFDTNGTDSAQNTKKNTKKRRSAL